MNDKEKIEAWQKCQDAVLEMMPLLPGIASLYYAAFKELNAAGFDEVKSMQILCARGPCLDLSRP